MKENIESLQRIRLIMDYDVSKTLYENTIQEQDIFDPSYVPNYESTFDFIQWMKTWNTHDWLLLLQVVLLILGFFTGGATALIAFLLSTGVDVTDAIIYYKEGDYYSATLFLILAIIPANELLKIPGLKDIIKKRGVDGLIKLIRKNKSGNILSSDEIKDLKFLGEKIVGGAKEIKILFGYAIKRLLMAYVSRKSTKWILNFLLAIRKTKTPVMVVGTAVLFDHLYLYAFRDDINKMNLRNNNTIVKIIKTVGDLLGWREVTPEMLKPEIYKEIEKMDISEAPSVPFPQDERAQDSLINLYKK
jgi:hypothetical protein